MDHDKKIEEVEGRIRQLQSQEEKVNSTGDNSPMEGSNGGMDFGVSILGGAFFGWLLHMAKPEWDPWPLLVLTGLGFLSGLVSVWRSLGKKSDK